jgi:CAAX protease family protein
VLVFIPSAAALIVTGFSEGRAGIRRLLVRLGRWRVGVRWYLAAIGVPLAGTSIPEIIRCHTCR